MLTTIGADKRFRKLRPDQQDLVFREMIGVRATMGTYKRRIAGADARMNERATNSLQLALKRILELRYSGVMDAVTLRLPNDKWCATRPFFEMAEAMLEACGHLNDNDEHYKPAGESELAAQAQREEVERLRDVLAQVGIRSQALVGRMVEFTSGQEITGWAVKKRLANKRKQRVSFPV